MKGNWWFVTGVYALFVWAYICIRIVGNSINMSDPFINGIPGAFWQWGIIAFTVSYVCIIAGVAEDGVLPRMRLVRVED
jgi:hypothetical protein